MNDKLMPTDQGGGSGLPGGLMDGPDGLGPLGSQTPASFTSGSSGSKVSGQVLLAAGVLAIAGGAIYGMRFVGLNAAFGGESIKIDYTGDKSIESAKRFDRVMSELDASMTAVQVLDTRTLSSAPFTRPAEDEPEVANNEPSSLDDLSRLARLAAEQQRKEAEARAQALAGELARLNVQGIVGGRVPAARINGQPVRVGQQLGSFTVTDIAGQSVFVEADGVRYELGIGAEPRRLD